MLIGKLFLCLLCTALCCYMKDSAFELCLPQLAEHSIQLP